MKTNLVLALSLMIAGCGGHAAVSTVAEDAADAGIDADTDAADVAADARDGARADANDAGEDVQVVDAGDGLDAGESCGWPNVLPRTCRRPLLCCVGGGHGTGPICQDPTSANCEMEGGIVPEG